MRVKRFIITILAIMAVSSITSAAEFMEDFESYAAGSDLHGQAGWKGWDNTASAGALVSSTHAYSGANSVQVLGTSDLVHQFDQSGGLWVFTAMQYIPSGTTGESFFILLNQYSDGGGQDWSVQINFNLATGILTTEMANGETTNIVYDQWIELKLIIDLKNNTVDEYYNGSLLSSHTWDDNEHGTLQAIDLYGNSASSIYYDDIKIGAPRTVYSPTPSDGELITTSYTSLRWSPGFTAASHDVYLGTDYDDVLTGTGNTFLGNQTSTYYVIGFAPYPYPEGLVPGTTYFWRVDEIEANGQTKYTGDLWSFMVPPYEAYNPIPADGALFVDPKNAQLTWSAGYNAMVHTIYFSDDYDTVANGAVGEGEFVPDTSFTPETLEPGKTYYYRVDEFNPTAQTLYKGNVWSFTTAAPGGGLLGSYYHGMNFQTFILNRIDDQINFSWGANAPATGMNIDSFSVRWVGEIEIPFQETYTFTTRSDDGIRLWVDDQLVVDSWIDQAATNHSGNIILSPGKYSIQVDYYENGGDATAQLSWASPRTPSGIVPQAALSPPIKASNPFPINNSDNARSKYLELRWNAGIFAVSHDVYFGSDEAALANATKASPQFKGNQTGTTYAPLPGGELEWDTTYYWRVDEVNNMNPDSPWKGNIWSFTTANFVMIEDFEDYNDDPPDRIFETWVDGNFGPTNGAIAGYPSPIFANDEHFCETEIVHNGLQSGPMFYDNNHKYSEITRTLPTGLRDWTQHGIKALNLWYYGHIQSQGSLVENPVGTFAITGTGSDIWNLGNEGDYHDEFHYAWKSLGSGAASITAKVQAPTGTNMNDWVKAGLMIRESLDPNSVHAFMCLTNNQGVAFQYRAEPGGASTNIQQASITERPQWLRLTKDIAGAFIAYHANDVGGSPGTWAQVGTYDIQMNTPCYIGLAITSHQAGVTATATFSNITSTGTVTGTTWTNQDIGIQTNDPEQMYVMIKDSAGQMATVYNPDFEAANVTQWTAWGQYGQGIALSEFTDANPGLNLTDIDTISLGFGTRGNTTQAGGSGLMFFDDIGLFTPQCVYQLGKPVNDYNNNCLVDMPDMMVLANEWLLAGPDLQADVDLNQVVDFKDFALFANTWLDEVLWP